MKTKEEQKETSRLYYLKHKESIKKRVAEYAEKNKDSIKIKRKEYFKIYNKKYSLTDKSKESRKRWRSNNPDKVAKHKENDYAKNRDKYIARNLEYVVNNKEVHRAHGKVGTAVLSGKLNKPAKCSKCNKKAKRIEGHHSDYTKPLDVIWLCCKCHRNLHIELKKI